MFAIIWHCDDQPDMNHSRARDDRRCCLLRDSASASPELPSRRLPTRLGLGDYGYGLGLVQVVNTRAS